MSLTQQYFLSGALKYLMLIGVPLGIAFFYFKVYTVEESISYLLVAVMAVGAVCAVKFGRKALDKEFPFDLAPRADSSYNRLADCRAFVYLNCYCYGCICCYR